MADATSQRPLNTGIVPGFLSSSKSLRLPAVVSGLAVASVEANGGANLV